MVRTYEAKVTKVVDGDTFTAVVDLGFEVFVSKKFRMLGINAPELHADDPEERKKAVEAMDYLKGLIENQNVQLDVHGTDKYSRYLCIVHLPSGVNVNDEMVNSGHAVVYQRD